MHIKTCLGRTETRTHERKCFQSIRTVLVISRDDRASIETCSLITATDRQTDIIIIMENYSIKYTCYSEVQTIFLISVIFLIPHCIIRLPTHASLRPIGSYFSEVCNKSLFFHSGCHRNNNIIVNRHIIIIM